MKNCLYDLVEDNQKTVINEYKLMQNGCGFLWGKQFFWCQIMVFCTHTSVCIILHTYTSAHIYIRGSMNEECSYNVKSRLENTFAQAWQPVTDSERNPKQINAEVNPILFYGPCSQENIHRIASSETQLPHFLLHKVCLYHFNTYY